MIIQQKDLSRIRKKHRHQKIVYCSGAFDLPHIGHMLHLEYCKKLGDILVVNIAPDKDIKKNKDPKRPILDEKIRLKTISSIKPVDYCFLSKHSPTGKPQLYQLESILRCLKPDIYVINKDSPSIIPEIKKLCRNLDIKLVIAKRKFPQSFKDISTSKIIEVIIKKFSKNKY